MSCPNRLASGTSAALLLGALLIVAPSVRADRVRVVPSVNIDQEYSTNPAGATSGREVGDMITRITPEIRLESAGDVGTASFRGGVRFRRHWDLTDLDSDDPYMRLKLQRNLTDVFSVSLNGDWTKLTNQDPVENDGVFLLGGRPDVERLNLGGGARYMLNQRTSLSANYVRASSRYTVTDFSDPQRDFFSDIYSIGASRIATPRDTLSANMSLRMTTFDAIQTQTGSGSGTQDDSQIEAGLGWMRTLSPTVTGSINLGLRYLTTEGEQFFPSRSQSLPLLGIGFDDDTLAFTGGLSFVRTGKRTRTSLGFHQSTQPAGGRTGSQDVSTLSLQHSRELNSSLSLELGGSYSQQQSASEGQVAAGLTEVPFDECFDRGGFPEGSSGLCVFSRTAAEVDTKVVRAFAKLRWRVRKRVNVFFSYRYGDYDAQGSFGRTFTDQRVKIGFRYLYDIDVP